MHSYFWRKELEFNTLIYVIIDSRSVAAGEREASSFQVPHLRKDHSAGQAWERYRRVRYPGKVLIDTTTVLLSHTTTSTMCPSPLGRADHAC